MCTKLHPRPHCLEGVAVVALPGPLSWECETCCDSHAHHWQLSQATGMAISWLGWGIEVHVGVCMHQRRSCWEEPKGKRQQKHSTRGSRVIPQHSTNLAQTRLTSEIGRDRVLSGWYDRAMRGSEFTLARIPRARSHSSSNRGTDRCETGPPIGRDCPAVRWRIRQVVGWSKLFRRRSFGRTEWVRSVAPSITCRGQLDSRRDRWAPILRTYYPSYY